VPDAVDYDPADEPRPARPKTRHHNLAAIDVRFVRTTDDVLDFWQWLGNRRDWLGIDTETTGLNVGKDFVRLSQFGDATMGWAFDHHRWSGVVKEAIEGYRGNMVAHNLLFDSKMLLRDGIRIPQRWAHDSMVMAHLDNPMWSQALKPLAKRLVHPQAASIGQGVLEQVFKANKWDWATVPIDCEPYWVYGALDTCLAALVAEELWPRIAPYREWYEVELACIHVLRDAELAGLGVDMRYCEAAAYKLSQELAALAPQIPWDPNSDKQTVEALLALGVPLTHLTEKGNLSTNKAVLKYHAEAFPICGLVADYRSKDRLLGSYIQKLMDLQAFGRVHCNTHPTAAKTGRMSVTDPPLQTLPRGRVVRDAFIAAEGCSLVIADYAAMEMRVMAADAGEESMCDAFLRGEDIHNFTSAAVYGANFTKKQRSTAKNAGFAKIYGAGIPKFAETAGIPINEAEHFLSDYDRLFPGVARWQEQVVQGVYATAPGRKKTGYVETTHGRRLPLKTDDAYKACNYRIQGSCSEVLKMKIVELANAGLGDFFRLPVHDELLFECPTEIAEDVRHVVEEVMPDRRTYSLPLTVESNIVRRWGDNYDPSEYPIYLPEIVLEEAA
jgi:DNA polymerase I